MFLVEVCQEHFDVLEADFERFYNGLDLLDLYRGTLPARKAANLAANLPAGALIWQEMEHPNSWTTTDYLLAAQVDAQNVANWIAAGGKQADKPKPLPRPSPSNKNKKKTKGEIKAAATRFMEKRKTMPVIVSGPPAEDT